VVSSLLVCAGAAAAQEQVVTPDTSEIAPGDGVRITAPALGLADWRGAFVEALPDSVRVRSPDAITLTIALADIESFMVNHGNKPPSGNALTGAVLGGLVGAIVGIVAGTHDDATGCVEDDPSLADCTPEQFQKGGIGLLIGAGLGAGIGALIKTSHWQYVPIVPPPEVEAFRAPNGAVVVALGFRF